MMSFHGLSDPGHSLVPAPAAAGVTWPSSHLSSLLLGLASQELSIMGAHREVQVQWVAAPTGAQPLLYRIKTQEKHLTVIGAAKLHVCEKERKERWLIFTGLWAVWLPDRPTEQADIICDYSQTELFHVLSLLAQVNFHTLGVSVACFVTVASKESDTLWKTFVLRPQTDEAKNLEPGWH